MADSGSWGRAQAPARWAQALPPHELPGAIATHNRPLSRGELRELCRDPAVDVLTAYLCIIAWGGQRRDHGRDAWRHRDRIERALTRLREEHLGQNAAFNVFAAEDPIKCLAVHFFTKLIFFFSEASVRILHPGSVDREFIEPPLWIRSYSLGPIMDGFAQDNSGRI